MKKFFEIWMRSIQMKNFFTYHICEKIPLIFQKLKKSLNRSIFIFFTKYFVYKNFKIWPSAKKKSKKNFKNWKTFSFKYHHFSLFQNNFSILNPFHSLKSSNFFSQSLLKYHIFYIKFQPKILKIAKVFPQNINISPFFKITIPF